MVQQATLMWAASAVSVLTFFVHTFVGGKVVARPLLEASGLTRATRWLSYYCWHIVTLVILALAVAFGAVALYPTQIGLGVFATLLCAVLSALSIAVAFKGGINALRFPSTTLFAVAALLGAAGICAGA